MASSGAANITNALRTLREDRAALALERKRLTKAIKATSRKRSRLMTRMRGLSDDDIQHMVTMRAAGSNGAGSASSGSGGNTGNGGSSNGASSGSAGSSNGASPGSGSS